MTNWTLDTAPLIPPVFYWLAALVAAALIVVLIWRRARGATLRALALGALLLTLANPTLREEERQGLANIVVVLVDESTSQTLADRPAQTAAIRADLEKRLAAIPNLDVRFVDAGKPADGSSPGTNLFADLNRALANTPTDRLAGVIMITDGQVHDVPTSAAALGFDAPVHALLSGKPNEFDRRIEIVKAPKFGLVGSTADIQVRVLQSGKSSAPDTVSLKVRREGQPDQTLRTVLGRIVTLPMPIPHAGQNIVEIEAETADGELTPANNRAVVVAEGVRENLRVLLVSGEPHAGERTWRNLLKSDAAVDLVHFTILRPPIKQDGTPIKELSLIAFPTRELFSDKIKDFDLIIFDRYQNRDNILQWNYYDNIAHYVENGGALLVAAGDDYAQPQSIANTALAPVLPAQPTGRVLEHAFRARLSPDGLKHPVTRGLTGSADAKGDASKPTWGQWFRQVDVDAGHGYTLMSGLEGRPLLVLDRKGKGRVALMASDQAWLWARGYDGGGPHTDLLRRLAHWLMKEPDLEEERLIASAKGLRLTIERRTMEQQIQPVTIQKPGGEQSTIKLDVVAPGLFRSTIEVAQPGLYKLETRAKGDEPNTTRSLTAVALAGVDDPKEMSEVVATADKMQPITDATGGGVFWTRGNGLLSSSTAVDLPRISLLQNAHVLAGNGWLGLKDRQAFITKGVKVTPMFNGLAALTALLALIALAWWREGR